MTAPIGAEDVAAFGDVLNLMAEEVDGASFPRLLELEALLQKVATQTKTVLDAVDRRMNQLAVDRQQVGNFVYKSKPVLTWRPDQARLRSFIAGRALHDDNGAPVTEPAVAVGRALEIASRCWVSPATMPKVDGLRMLGKENDDFAEQEHTRWKLHRYELKSEVPE